MNVALHLLAAATLALPSACGSAPTRTYTVYAVAPATVRGDYAGPPVRVDAVHVPPSLNRLEIVTAAAPGELRLDDLAHWAAPLNQGVRQALSADLIARLPAGRVIYPHLAKPDGALGITVDLLLIELGPSVGRLQASWTVVAGGTGMSNGARGAARGGAASWQIGPSTPGAAGAADSLSYLVGQLADRIAADL